MLYNNLIRNKIKIYIGFLLRRFIPIRWYLRDKLTIFTFHEVSDNPSKFCVEFDLAVSSEVFRAQVEWINDNFNVISPESLDSPYGSADFRMPSMPAIITFDDGFLGVFKNALPILKENKIKPVIFLNMQNNVEHTNIVSAKCAFLKSNCYEFKEFIKKNNIKDPIYLNINPTLMNEFELYNGDKHKLEISAYQGSLADMPTIKNCNRESAFYGNHLYQHWNAVSLTEAELIEQFKLNKFCLDQLSNSLNLFAFTYGKINICWTTRDVQILNQLGVNRIFTTQRGVNRVKNSRLLGRVSLPTYTSESNAMWFSIFRTIVGL